MEARAIEMKCHIPESIKVYAMVECDFCGAQVRIGSYSGIIWRKLCPECGDLINKHQLLMHEAIPWSAWA